MEILPRNKKLRSRSTQMRSEPTPQERHLWYDFLRAARPQWNRQRIIGSYIVDFYCAKARLVIELDGGQHYNESGLIEYDRVRTEDLEALGLNVLRFTNPEVDHNFLAVCQKIQVETERLLKKPVQKNGEC